MKKQHKKWRMGLVVATSVLLTACGGQSEDEQADDNVTNESESTAAVHTTDLNKNMYRPVMRDGQYQPSKSRGITLRLNSSMNIKAFERGLLDLSTETFPTDEYYFEEGQYIPSDVVNNWLGRKSDSNADGLNPEDNGEVAEDARNPIYLQSLLEQDYYKETDEGIRLEGISIGLALNAVDYYQKESYGATFETEIPREKLLEEGQAMADEVVKRIREVEGLEDVTIVVGLFEQSAIDDLAGGVYIKEGVSSSGSTAVSSWDDLTESKSVLPLDESESNEGSSFSNFKKEVENFFPNLSGVTGRVSYRSETPVSMVIDINTQFYGEGEIIAFAQHVKTVAEEYLPSGYPIEINIDSLEAHEAFLSRDGNQEKFSMHVFQ